MGKVNSIPIPKIVDEFRRAVLRVPQNKREQRRVFIRVSVSNLLQAMRIGAGLTQKELAKRLDMRQPDISHIERALGSRAAELLTVVRVAEACDFEVELVAKKLIGAKHRKKQVERAPLTLPRR